MSPGGFSRLSSTNSKRDTPDSERVSPPPLKRKAAAQSTISKNAVANFFTPTSQKPKDRTTWTERSPNSDTPATLLVGKYVPDKEENSKSATLTKERTKIAAFDFDSTLIAPASGKRHAHDAADWKWWHHSVPGRLRQMYNDEGYQVVVFTNQGGLTLHPDPKSKTPKIHQTRVPAFKQKCGVVLAQLDIPITVYAATGKDIFRKPRPGMWNEMKADYDLDDSDIDLEHCIFIGDAGGRAAEVKGGATIPKDFSCSDRNLADNIGIKFQTPDEFFLGEAPRAFTRDFDVTSFEYTEPDDKDSVVFEKTNKQDVVLFVGPPGAGKSSFYWKHLEPLSYWRINQDILKSKEKCFKEAADGLKVGASIIIDNTNPDPEIRAQWIELAKKHKVPIRCVWFKTPLQLCEHNDAVRSLNKQLNPESRSSLPKLAFNGFASRFKEPKIKEGFQDIVEVDFKFQGTKEEFNIWARYWL